MGNLFADAVAAVAESEEPYVVRVQMPEAFDDEAFWRFCRQNPELQIEQTAEGELILMPPAGGDTGHQNSALNAQLYIWAEKDDTGRSFDSSTGFRLPSGAKRSPDAAWVPTERLATLTPAEIKRFPPICPDFVVELRSPSDRLAIVQSKMEEYIVNGTRLGWLIDPELRTLHVYRPGVAPRILSNPTSVSADPELPGFVLNLNKIWAPLI